MASKQTEFHGLTAWLVVTIFLLGIYQAAQIIVWVGNRL